MPYTARSHYVPGTLSQGLRDFGQGLMNRRVQQAMEAEQAKIEEEQLKAAEASTKARITIMEQSPEAYGGEDAVRGYVMQARGMGPKEAAGFLATVTTELDAARMAQAKEAKLQEQQQAQQTQAAVDRQMQQLGQFQSMRERDGQKMTYGEFQNGMQGIPGPAAQSRYGAVLEDPNIARTAKLYHAIQNPRVASVIAGQMGAAGKPIPGGANGPPMSADGQYFYSGQQWQKAAGAGNDGPPEGQPQLSADGRFYAKDGQWTPVPGQGGGGPRIDAPTMKRYTTRVAEINSELDTLSAELSTADEWKIWPGKSKGTVKKQITELENEKAGLEAALSGRGSTPGMPASSSTPAAAPTNFATMEEANAALERGTYIPGTIITVGNKQFKVEE